MKKKEQYKLSEIASYIGAKIRGDSKAIVTNIATLQNAKSNSLSFLAHSQYKKYLSNTKACAVIINEGDLADCKTNALLIADPYLGYAKVTSLFVDDNVHIGKRIVHPTTTIAASAKISSNVVIEANAVIEDYVQIDNNVRIGAGCYIGRNTVIGENSIIKPNASILRDVFIGKNVSIGSGAVIGEDGFGFANDNGKWLKIQQLGGVIIQDNVNVGANSCVDRGALEDTIIAEGAIIDNHVQIAHNVYIGKYTAIAGCTGIAGSTKIGDYCLIGGGACIAGHLEIASRVYITGAAMITTSISEEGSSYGAMGNGTITIKEWRKCAARYRQLDKIAKRLTALEKKLS